MSYFIIPKINNIFHTSSIPCNNIISFTIFSSILLVNDFFTSNPSAHLLRCFDLFGI